MTELDLASLARVVGGSSQPAYNPSDNALGRVGPGRGMGFLGNYYTPEAFAHDRQVRDAIANGSSPFMAHTRALPGLWSAAKSYVRARTNPGPHDVQLPG